MSVKMPTDGQGWDFIHNLAKDADWKPGMRAIFDYRDLGAVSYTHLTLPTIYSV